MLIHEVHVLQGFDYSSWNLETSKTFQVSEMEKLL